MEILELLLHFFERPLIVGSLIIAVILVIVLVPDCEKREPPPPPPPKCQKYTPKITLKVWKVEAPIQVGTKCR